MVFQQKILIWDITCYGPTLTFATLKTRKELVSKYGPQKDLIHDARHLCSRSRIDGIKAMSRGISGGKQVIKFANTSNRGRVCLFYQNETTTSKSCKPYISSFSKIYVITVCHVDIYGRYCIQKSNNDHFHPYFDIIVFKMKRSSFPVD